MDWLNAFWEQLSDQQEVLKLGITVLSALISAASAVFVAHAWRTSWARREQKKITVQLRKSGRRLTFEDRHQLELKLGDLEEELRIQEAKIKEAEAQLMEQKRAAIKRKRRRT